MPHADPLEAAIGLRPDDYLAARAWDRATEALHPELDLSPHLEPPSLALEL